MPLTVQPINGDFAARVTGVCLGPDIGDDDVAGIVSAINRYAVLVFPGQLMSNEDQIAFSALIGPLETSRRVKNPNIVHRFDTRLTDVSNLDEEERMVARDSDRRMIAMSNRLWHTDSSFRQPSAKYSLLSAHAVVSEGGETQFADMRAAWDALPEDRKRMVEDKVALHWLTHTRRKTGFDRFSDKERTAEPPVPQPLVREPAGTGRKSLYLSAHAERIEGMTVPEGRLLLLDLIEHATQPRFVYSHTWQVGDLVMWDNRCTMHRAREFGLEEVRDLRRTTIEDSQPAADRAGAA